VWAVAASTLLAAFIGSLWIVNRFAHTIETARGERRELILSDGSLVQVDPESRLRVRLDETSRRIELEGGRAWFKVAPDPKRPFVVEAQGATVRALGTAFAVEQQDVGVRVTVSEGKVVVSLPSALEHGSRQLSAAPVLIANEQLTVKKSGSSEPVKEVDANKELAWIKGRLVFENQPVAKVLQEFNRYNPVQLKVADDELARVPVTAVFDASDPESFVAFLESVTAVQVTRENGNSIVLATAR
jgi:transmembrane sensor